MKTGGGDSIFAGTTAAGVSSGAIATPKMVHEVKEGPRESCVIVDNGSLRVKAGLSGASLFPQLVLPSVVGQPKIHCADSFVEPSQRFAGDSLNALRDKLSLSETVVNGNFTSCLLVEELWESVFESLGLWGETEAEMLVENHPVLLSEPPFASFQSSAVAAEVLFEYFGIQEVRFALQGVLALLGLGKTTGVVVEIGDSVTQVVPVYDGYAISHSVQRADIGGRDVTMLLQRAFCDKGCPLTSRRHFDLVRGIKERHCYASLDPATDVTYPRERFSVTQELDFVSHCGSDTVEIAHERFMCPEFLFNPSLIGREEKGIGHLVWKSLSTAGIDVRSALYKNIFVTGGGSLLTNMPERLQAELRQLAPGKAGKQISVHAWDGREFAVYQGGVQLCQPSIRAMETDLWIQADEYQEEGSRVVQRKAQLKQL